MIHLLHDLYLIVYLAIKYPIFEILSLLYLLRGDEIAVRFC